MLKEGHHIDQFHFALNFIKNFVNSKQIHFNADQRSILTKLSTHL